MAVSITVGVQASNNFNNQASFVTGSWTPTANRLLIAVFQTQGSTAQPSISGNGLTWSLLTDQQYDTVGSRYRLTTWVALTGATPSTGAITITPTVNCNGYTFVCDQVDGADISGTALQAIVQTKLGPVDAASAASLTITLDSAITSGNASYGGLTHENSGGTQTEGSGYTKLGEQAQSTPGRLITEYKAAGSTTVDSSWSVNGIPGGVGMEIKAAAVASTAVPVFTNQYRQRWA